MMIKHTELAQVYLATQLLFADKPKSGWSVLGSVALSSASNGFKQGWAFDVIALHCQC